METMTDAGDDTPVIYRWDLDKTYLLSEFESLREMMRIPFERAEDKIAAPGVAALIRGLRTAALGRGRGVRVYFLSASPPQIGRAIRRKLELDGILYDGIVFKDQLQRLFRRHDLRSREARERRGRVAGLEGVCDGRSPRVRPARDRDLVGRLIVTQRCGRHTHALPDLPAGGKRSQ